jgi:hypothetical protein
MWLDINTHLFKVSSTPELIYNIELHFPYFGLRIKASIAVRLKFGFLTYLLVKLILRFLKWNQFSYEKENT